ncbi:aldolase [Acidiphilium sp. AL]|uniref:aldolase n=1 Tax=Acidiphilium sp. AL TaxID=2871704 RepID=UPI00291694D9|nr:aldolase [Acidiphilium sp. AL]MCU4161225.1 aldolase [Acidiphilium sp. AL]
MPETIIRPSSPVRSGTARDPASLARSSGGYAMLAIDQREALRAMLAEHTTGPVSDATVTDFKLAVTRALSPFASAILLDRDFIWDRAIAERAVAPSCALIAAADRFIPSEAEFVADVEIDDAVVPDMVRDQGATALKLLVIWRPDEPAEPRIAMVRRFVTRCRAAGLVSIIEPVARRSRHGGRFDWEAGVIAAARELGALGADLYKAEVPLHGNGAEAAIRIACTALTRAIASPWVVLSSGVEPDKFPRAVALACAEGASGFLAGRAVWQPVIGMADRGAALASAAADRLKRLCEITDRAMVR